jgi:hypothetical protein
MRLARFSPILLLLIFVNMSVPLSGESDETYGTSAQPVHRHCLRTVRAVRDLQVSALDRPAAAADTDLRARPAETLRVSIDFGGIRKIPPRATGIDSPSEDH